MECRFAGKSRALPSSSAPSSTVLYNICITADVALNRLSISNALVKKIQRNLKLLTLGSTFPPPTSKPHLLLFRPFFCIVHEALLIFCTKIHFKAYETRIFGQDFFFFYLNLNSAQNTLQKTKDLPLHLI